MSTAFNRIKRGLLEAIEHAAGRAPQTRAIDNNVYCMVFVEREDDVMRIISLRKTTKQEVRDYANQI